MRLHQKTLRSLLSLALLLGPIQAKAADGDFGWSKNFGGAIADEGIDVATDAQGNVILAASMRGTSSLGTSHGGSDIAIAKLSPSGSVTWVKNFGGTPNDDVSGLAVDKNGDVLIIGSFTGSTNLGGTPLTAAGTSGFGDIFVAKYSGVDGSHLWSKSFGGASDDSGWAVATDGNSNVLVTGGFVGSVVFGATTLTSRGGNDVFVAKLAPTTGVVTWAKDVGGTSSPDIGVGIAADATGNIFVTGLCSGSVDFGNGSSIAGDSMFVAKYDSNGVYGWAKRPLAINFANIEAKGLAVDSSGNLFVTGSYSNSVDFGNGVPVVSNGAVDMYIAKFAGATGACQWAKGYGGADAEIGVAVAADSTGNPTVAGGFSGSANFGSTTLTANGSSQDIFVAKYNASTGAPIWNKQMGGAQGDSGNGVGNGPGGLIYVTGSFQGPASFGTTSLTAPDQTENIFVTQFSGSGAVTNIPHPADIDQNFQISQSEMTTYGACWKTANCVPANPPTVIPIGYVTQLGPIWKAINSGYHYRSDLTCPQCWEPN